MIITIDTNKLTCTFGNSVTVKNKTLADAFEEHIGAKEWDSFVTSIQKWYYGSLVKDAWCCTSVSYFAHQLGLDSQVPKNENVDRLKDFMVKQGKLDCTKNYGGGAYVAKRGDLVFFSNGFNFKDCTHVGVVQEIHYDTGWLTYISGNANDSIMSKTTNFLTNKYTVAFGRVDY